MISSMTGFGRHEISSSDRKLGVEIKSVNHRYCDINIKMPRMLAVFESQIRQIIKEKIERGKVDVFVAYENNSDMRSGLKYNRALAKEYMDAFRQMQEDFQIENDICVSQLSRYPDVLSLEDHGDDENAIWQLIEPALVEALDSLVQSRRKEGEKLRSDLAEKLDNMLNHVEYIEERTPELMGIYRDSLAEKMRELLGDPSVDESRLAMEAAIYADKICIDEEIVRLRSHIGATRDALFSQGSVGRKLDFLAQEMNREANTILSKSSDLSVSDHAIALKTDIEKIREQIQNIE